MGPGEGRSSSSRNHGAIEVGCTVGSYSQEPLAAQDLDGSVRGRRKNGDGKDLKIL